MTEKKPDTPDEYDANLSAFVREIIKEYRDIQEDAGTLSEEDLDEWADGVLSIAEDTATALVERLVAAFDPNLDEDEDDDYAEEDGYADG